MSRQVPKYQGPDGAQSKCADNSTRGSNRTQNGPVQCVHTYRMEPLALNAHAIAIARCITICDMRNRGKLLQHCNFGLTIELQGRSRKVLQNRF